MSGIMHIIIYAEYIVGGIVIFTGLVFASIIMAGMIKKKEEE